MNIPEWPAVEVQEWILTPGSVWTDDDGTEYVTPPQYVARILTQHKGKHFSSPMVLSLEDVEANQDQEAIQSLLSMQHEVAMLSLKDVVENA
jgi:hypothetical protein